MDSYRIFQTGVPRGKARLLATMLGKSPDLINRWSREPLSSDNPSGTGVTNPVDRMDLLFDFFLVHAPEAAELIAQRYQQKLTDFYNQPARKGDWKEKLRAGIRETAEAVQAAATGASADELELEVAEAITALRALVASRRAI